MSVNLGRVAYVEKGKYKSDTTYESKDVVSFNGGSYVFIGDTPAANVPPTDEVHWQPLIDPTAMNEKIAEMDGVKQEALAAAATASEKAQEATAAAETANTAAQRADEARESFRAELNGKASVIINDASGEIVHITDGAAMPVECLVSHIEPKQEGSGDPSPDNVRTIIGWDAVTAQRKGKNLVNAKVNATSSNVTASGDNGIIVMNGTASASSSSSLKIYEITLKPGIYTMSHKVLSGSAEGASASTSVLLYKVDGTIIHRTRLDTPSVTFAVTEEETARMEIIRAGSAVTYNAFTFSVQLEKGDTATDFEPPNMQTLTATLPETLYGFDKNWTTGLVTVNKLCLVWDGTEGWQMGTNSSGLTTFRIGSNVDKRMAAIKQETNYNDYDFISSHFNRVRYYAPEKPDGSATMVDGTMGRTLLLVNSAWATVEDCTTYLAAQAAAGNPLTGVFDLAEPYTIQLTPQQLSTLKGTNNIWSDAGATDVTYVADTKMYIDGKIAAIAAAIV